MYALNQGFHNFHNGQVNIYDWDETVICKGSHLPI